MPVLARTTAMAIGLLGGLAAAQGPEFAQQYRQRLGGAVDELRRVVERFEADARATGETREGAVERLGRNPDELARRQGEGARQAMTRLERLEGQQRTLAEAGPFGRLAALVRNADPELAARTFQDYEPALPATEEGLVAGAAGFAVVWGGCLVLLTGIGGLLRRRHTPRVAVRPR